MESILSKDKDTIISLLEVRQLVRRDALNAMKPNDYGFVVLGTFIMWLGWLMFNAGSTLTLSSHSKIE